ncbi:hypothetical protein ACFRFC_19295 [Streptomyces sp. NPDC056734]|uniref:hypothetical protein n=1 Tax=Streptomyces sp. NPDC056734 TaxID=3345931 RepID=UPI0036C362BA
MRGTTVRAAQPPYAVAPRGLPLAVFAALFATVHTIRQPTAKAWPVSPCSRGAARDIDVTLHPRGIRTAPASTAGPDGPSRPSYASRPPGRPHVSGHRIAD